MTNFIVKYNRLTPISSWMPVNKIYIKKNDSWESIEKVYVKRNNTWTEIE